jgi:hypothetical protein
LKNRQASIKNLNRKDCRLILRERDKEFVTAKTRLLPTTYFGKGNCSQAKPDK